MKQLIRQILKEETNLVDPKKILILKNFIMDYFSETDWFKDVDLEVSFLKSFMSPNQIPLINIKIYTSKINEIDFTDFIDEIDFLMGVLFPKDKSGKPDAVWEMETELI